MRLDLERVLINIRKSETRDLLNRATVFKLGMEKDVIPLVVKELADRGVSQEMIDRYDARMRGVVVMLEDGCAAKCSLCHEPAVTRVWGSHKLLGLIPLFPRPVHYCTYHQPDGKGKIDNSFLTLDEALAETSPNGDSSDFTEHQTGVVRGKEKQ
ncbi:MAG: hypothetical protein ACFCD0_05090 [Gemmataceae bacterium]